MLQGSLKRGLLVGLKTTWTLGKIIFPITLIVALLQYTPVLPWVIKTISSLFLIRLGVAIVLTLIVGTIWKRKKTSEKEGCNL